jgi:hypothetical protein
MTTEDTASQLKTLRKEFDAYKREVEKTVINLAKRIENLEKRDQFRGR